MKSLFLFFLMTYLLFSCGTGEKDKTTSSNSNEAKKTSGSSDNSDEKGKVWLSGLKIKKEKLKAEKCLDVPREEWMEEEPEPFCASTEVDLMKISLNEHMKNIVQ